MGRGYNYTDPTPSKKVFKTSRDVVTVHNVATVHIVYRVYIGGMPRKLGCARHGMRARPRQGERLQGQGYNMGYNMGDFQSPPYVVVVDSIMLATSGNIGLHYNGVSSCDLHATSRSMSPAWMGGQKTQAFPTVSQIPSPLTSHASA